MRRRKSQERYAQRDTAELRRLAAEAAGNWKKFNSFAWDHWRDDDADQWCIVYTSNRDSTLLDQSNAEVIDKIMGPFVRDGDTCRSERHDHWAVGHVDGYAIRVYRSGRRRDQITGAFRAWLAIKDALADYPVLDDQHYSQKEYDATISNIREAGGYLERRRDDIALPEGWEGEVFSHLWDTGNSLENRDDQGGYPSDEKLLEAFAALGYMTEDLSPAGESA